MFWLKMFVKIFLRVGKHQGGYSKCSTYLKKWPREKSKIVECTEIKYFWQNVQNGIFAVSTKIKCCFKNICYEDESWTLIKALTKTYKDMYETCGMKQWFKFDWKIICLTFWKLWKAKKQALNFFATFQKQKKSRI